MDITTASRYGALQDGFAFHFPDTGFTVLTGANNAGKSAILQLAFRVAMSITEIGYSKVALLMPERTYVQSSAETASRNLEQFNNELLTQLQGTVYSYDTPRGPASSELPRLLLNHTSLMKQLMKLNDYLKRLGFLGIDLKGSQNIHFEDVAVQFQGSGLRGLFTILCALSDEMLQIILIDEPELSLEPKLQKVLRDLLVEESKNRAIVIATHSHLMLQRENIRANHIVKNSPNSVSITEISSPQLLFDLTFGLLGNDTQDLFFPYNYIVVEGVSDQVLCERVLTILNEANKYVKVIAAGGMTRVKNKLSAIEDSLTPLLVNDSPYAKRIAVLIDQPNDGEKLKTKELKKHLGNRLFTLPVGSIEEYMPEELYTKAGRTKAEDLKKMESLKSDLEALRAFKKAVSEQLAGQIAVEDLPNIKVIQDIVKKALGVK